MKFNLKNTVIDYIVIGSLIIASGIFTALFYLNDEEGASVSVYYHSEKITTLNLKEDSTFVMEPEDYPNLLGELIIEVKDGQVRVAKEQSPIHTCSKQGWVKTPGWMITCLPNDVYLIVEGKSDFDAPPIGTIYYTEVELWDEAAW